MEIESTRVFVKVVQLGSFSKAASLLKLPKSTVSRTITKLEAESGTRLLVRTTRSLTLTAAGRAFFDSVSTPIQALEDAFKSLQGKDSIVAGLVRITAPEDFGTQVISPVIGKLTKLHPGLTFELHYSDEMVDLVQSGTDLAVRVGRLSSSSFKVRKLGEIRLIPVASADYLKKNPTPIEAPQDLALHSCIDFQFGGDQTEWVLKSEKARATVRVKPRIVANQMTSLIGLAKQGAGIAFAPISVCHQELTSGRLVRLLPGWWGEKMDVSLVAPIGFKASARVRVVADALTDEVSRMLAKV